MCIAVRKSAKMFAVSACDVGMMSLMKPAFVWLGFRGPDCNVIAEQGGGPDDRPSWAGSGPRAGGCPTLR